MTDTPNRPLRALMGLRCVLSLWVVGNHLNKLLDDFSLSGPFIVMLFNNGYYAVDLFFMLSGIVLTHHYGAVLRKFDRRAYLHFLWRRLARLYPLHLFTLLLIAAPVAWCALHGEEMRWPAETGLRALLENLLLVQAWHVPVRLSWNLFAWSVSAEWFACLMLPAFLVLSGRVTSPTGRLIACLSFLMVVPLLHLCGWFPGELASPLIRVTASFGAGVLLYTIVPRTRPSSLLYGGGLTAFFLLLVIEQACGLRLWGLAMLPASLWMAALLRADLHDTPGHVGRALRHPTLRRGGELAYALYMLQLIVIVAIEKLLPHADYNDAPLTVRLSYLALMLAAIVAAALLARRFVEEPARA